MNGGKTVWAVVWRRSIIWIITNERGQPRYREMADAMWGESSLARTLATHYACPDRVRCCLRSKTGTRLRRYQHTQTIDIIVRGTRTTTTVTWPASRKQWHQLFLLAYSQTLDESLRSASRRT